MQHRSQHGDRAGERRRAIELGGVIGLALYLGYFLAAAISAMLLAWLLRPPSEVVRKALHLVAVVSIFPLVHLFDTWLMAAVAAAAFASIAYVGLAVVDRSAPFARFAVERKGGEFRSSLLIVQAMMIVLIVVFWGLLGPDATFIAVAAVMAWGFGDAAAALIGTSFGRHRIRHAWTDGAKTVEGTAAMVAVAALALFLTLVVYAGAPWQHGLAVAVLVAPAAAAVELVSRKGMDTLTVPIATSLAVWAVLALVAV